MIELPEAATLAKQCNHTIKGKQIQKVIAAASPHRFAWFFGDPAQYHTLLQGRTLEEAHAYGGRLEIEAEGASLHFGDGVNLRFFTPGEKLPPKHQLILLFSDESSLVCTVAMYGGMWCFHGNEFYQDNFYAKVAREKSSPLSAEFDEAYFFSLLDDQSAKLSAKAFLATEQRIPGLGNGTVQDILLGAKIHPKCKINTLSQDEIHLLFRQVKEVLQEMTALGGRDTEKDLFGQPGGYKTKLSKLNKALVCPLCGGAVKKENYLGGSIYYCTSCQRHHQ